MPNTKYHAIQKVKKLSSLTVAVSLALTISKPVLADSNATQQTAPSQNKASDNSVFELGEMVITEAVSGKLDSRDMLTSVDIMYPDKIENQNVQNSYELFNRMPGVQITQFNQGTTSGKLSFRGFNGEGNINAVKLLIDGIPSNINDGSMPFIDSVFPLDISSIETVRGTNDPRYGLHSIAGNAQITTQTGGNYLKGRASYGSFDSYDTQMGGGYEKNGFSQNYFVGYRNSQGYRDHSASDKYTISGKWSYTPDSQKYKVGLSARWNEAEAEEPGYLTFKDSRNNPTMTNVYNKTDGDNRSMGQISGHLDVNLKDDLFWSTKSYANVFDDKRFVKFSALASQQERNVNEVQYGATTSLTYRPKISWLDDFSLESGFDIHEQENKSSRYKTNDRVRTEQTRDQQFDFYTYGGYVQAMIQPFKWLKITPGFRADQVGGGFDNRLSKTTAAINNYGTIWQPKVGAVITPFDGYSLYGNWGRTFQVGVGSASYKTSSTATDLAPSINDGWEVGIKAEPVSWAEGRVAYWQQSATNEWRRQLNSANNDSINIGATDRQGVDVQVKINPIDPINIWAAFSLQKSIIATPAPSTPEYKGNSIDHSPNYIFSGGIDYQVTPQFKSSLWTTGQGAYFLEEANKQSKFGEYALLNLNLSYQVNKMVGLEFQVKNLADTRWEYAWYDPDNKLTLHSPGDGRAFYGAININYDL